MVVGAVLAVAVTLVVTPLFGRTVERAVVRALSYTGRVSHKRADVTGIWHSVYRYTTRDAQGEWQGHHYVEVRHFHNLITVSSIEHPEGSRLTMELALDESGFATGTWREETGRDFVFSGAIQLAVEPGGHRMTGRWVGYGRSGQIKSNVWTFERMTLSRRRRDRRHFEERGRREFALTREAETGARVIGYPEQYD